MEVEIQEVELLELVVVVVEGMAREAVLEVRRSHCV